MFHMMYIEAMRGKPLRCGVQRSSNASVPLFPLSPAACLSGKPGTAAKTPLWLNFFGARARFGGDRRKKEELWMMTKAKLTESHIRTTFTFFNSLARLHFWSSSSSNQAGKFDQKKKNLTQTRSIEFRRKAA